MVWLGGVAGWSGMVVWQDGVAWWCGCGVWLSAVARRCAWEVWLGIEGSMTGVRGCLVWLCGVAV